MRLPALTLALALLSSPALAQTEQICDVDCYNDLIARIIQKEQEIRDLATQVQSLQAQLNGPGGAAGGAIRNELAQCQSARSELVAGRQTLFDIIEGLNEQLLVKETSVLLNAMRELEDSNDELRLGIVLQQSQLLDALSRCFHGS